MIHGHTRPRRPLHDLKGNSTVIETSSLIDVCFLLLIYFLVTTAIAEPESDIIIQLPTCCPSRGSLVQVDPMLFHIVENGTISQRAHQFNRKVTSTGDHQLQHRSTSDMPELARTIGAYVDMVGSKAMVKVMVDDNTPAQYVIDFLNVLEAKNIKKITFLSAD